jgi:hypothetical protein
MKILFVKSNIHKKNLHFLLNCKKIEFTFIDYAFQIDNFNLSDFDAVISVYDSIDVSKYPKTKFIFGPHFSVFPNDKLNIIKGSNSIYNVLCNWNVEVFNQFELCKNLKLICLPFGVDTYKFINTKTLSQKNEVFVYFKNRNPNELNIIEQFLKNKNIIYTLFSYNKCYDENCYLNCLQNSKYGLWIGTHESQGFALQEALSCNVPLLVWNVTSMNQEYGSNYLDFKATTIPYWDYKCGEYFYDAFELEVTYNKFINNLENYRPREFIIENLSFDKCENKLIETICALEN